MNDSARTPDDLDRRIDAALRRRYAAPASLDTLAARLRPAPERTRLGPVLAFAAAAAAVIALGLWVGERSSRERAGVHHALAVNELPRSTTPFEPDPPFCRLASTLGGTPAVPGPMRSPDLARLYRDMDACQRGAMADTCEEDQLLAKHLVALDLRAAAADGLHGPFLSDEWPTGQILTGTSEGQTAIVVVERSATLDCCVRPKLAESSGLHAFIWPRGDVVLTEITPFAEPRLIQSLE